MNILVRDDDCHWFCIPVGLEDKFYEWLDWVDAVTDEEAGYDGPSFDQYMLGGGHQSIMFPSFEVRYPCPSTPSTSSSA